MTTFKKLALVAAIALTTMFAVNASSGTAKAGGGYPFYGGYNYGCHSHVYQTYNFAPTWYQPAYRPVVYTYKFYQPIYRTYPVYGGCHW